MWWSVAAEESVGSLGGPVDFCGEPCGSNTPEAGRGGPSCDQETWFPIGAAFQKAQGQGRPYLSAHFETGAQSLDAFVRSAELSHSTSGVDSGRISGANRLTRIHKFLTLRNMAAIHVCGDTVINRGRKLRS